MATIIDYFSPLNFLKICINIKTKNMKLGGASKHTDIIHMTTGA